MEIRVVFFMVNGQYLRGLKQVCRILSSWVNHGFKTLSLYLSFYTFVGSTEQVQRQAVKP